MTNNFRLDSEHQTRTATSLPRPAHGLNSSDTYLIKCGEDASESGSVHSGGAFSPAPGSDPHKPRSNRKAAAPRKLTIEAMLSGDDVSMNDELDESMYAHDESEPQVLDMSMKRRNDGSQVTSHDDHIASPVRVEPMSSCMPKSPTTAATSPANQQNLNNHNALPGSPVSTLGYQMRIGDLISKAVASCHTNFPAMDKLAWPRHSGLLTDSAHVPSSPKMKAKMYAKMYQSAQMEIEAKVEEQVASEIASPEKRLLAMKTGTYQITTEPVEQHENLAPEIGSSKVTKIVKQGNYLKLKKEAQLIDGELRFVCPHCNKLFHRSSNFSRHMRIHRGVFSYVCSTCTRGFYRKEHFDKHKCYRKSMASTWERKTKVDIMDGGGGTPEKCRARDDTGGDAGQHPQLPAVDDLMSHDDVIAPMTIDDQSDQ